MKQKDSDFFGRLKMRGKKIFISLFMIIFLGLIICLFIVGSRPEVLPLGSMMPQMMYRDSISTRSVTSDRIHPTIIVLFHLKCEHCIYQLKSLENRISDFSETRIYLFTVDHHFFTIKGDDRFPFLKSSSNVIWGVVDADIFRRFYGGLAMPSMYFFNKSGALTNKIRGEVRVERIMEFLALNN